MHKVDDFHRVWHKISNADLNPLTLLWNVKVWIRHHESHWLHNNNVSSLIINPKHGIMGRIPHASRSWICLHQFAVSRGLSRTKLTTHASDCTCKSVKEENIVICTVLSLCCLIWLLITSSNWNLKREPECYISRYMVIQG